MLFSRFCLGVGRRSGSAGTVSIFRTVRCISFKWRSVKLRKKISALCYTSIPEPRIRFGFHLLFFSCHPVFDSQPSFLSVFLLWNFPICLQSHFWLSSSSSYVVNICVVKNFAPTPLPLLEDQFYCCATRPWSRLHPPNPSPSCFPDLVRPKLHSSTPFPCLRSLSLMIRPSPLAFIFRSLAPHHCY